MKSLKKLVCMLTVLVPVFVFSSCAGEYIREIDDPEYEDDRVQSDLEYDDESENTENNRPSSDQDLAAVSLSDLKTFDVKADITPLSEKANVPTDENDPLYEDYVENYDVQNTVEITWSSGAAKATGAISTVAVTCNGGDVVINSHVKGMNYVLRGDCQDGMITIFSDYKFRLILENLTLANNDGPAINIQSGKRAYVVLNGTNTLSDSKTYASSDEDRKAAFFSEGQLCFSGKGSLDVTGHYKNAIASDDYLFFRNGPVINAVSSGTNGLKANDWIHIEGGVLNVETTSAGGKCLSSDGYVRINGGRTTLLAKGGVDMSDYSSSCCVKTDSVFVMDSGELFCKSTGQGGKGIKADMNAYFNGGTVRVITTGSNYGSSSNAARPKGIRVEGKLYVNGGDIMVRVSGHEGVESKSYIEVNGGRLLVHSSDDAINSAGQLIFNGGYVYAQATGNDALDSNGNMTVNGGVVFAAGPPSGIECGIDVNTEGRAYLTMNGGTLVCIGGGNNTPSKGTQCYSLYGKAGMGGGGGGGRPGKPGGSTGGGTSASLSAGKAYAVYGADSKAVLVFTLPVSGSSLLMSCKDMVKSSSYSLYSGVTAVGGTDFCGLNLGAEATGGTSVTTLTVTQL